MNEGSRQWKILSKIPGRHNAAIYNPIPGKVDTECGWDEIILLYKV